MVLGYVGGHLSHLRRSVDIYREAGERAGQPELLRVGLSTHFFAARTAAQTRSLSLLPPYLRPKAPGGRGWVVNEEQFRAATQRQGAIMVGWCDELIEKILDAHQALGVERFFGQIHWGGLPEDLVTESITLFADEIAPALRAMKVGR